MDHATPPLQDDSDRNDPLRHRYSLAEGAKDATSLQVKSEWETLIHWRRSENWPGQRPRLMTYGTPSRSETAGQPGRSECFLSLHKPSQRRHSEHRRRYRWTGWCCRASHAAAKHISALVYDCAHDLTMNVIMHVGFRSYICIAHLQRD